MRLRLLSLAILCAGVFGLTGAFAVADEKKEAPMVAEGKPAPEVELPAVQIEKVLPDKKDAKTLNLKEFHGKKNVVLFFFPKAMTRG